MISSKEYNKTTMRGWLIYGILIITLAVLVPCILTDRNHSLTKLILAGLLLSICLFPATLYWVSRERYLPSFPIFILAYALQFAIPIYTRNATITLAGAQISILDDDAVIACLFLTILGVLALIGGFYGFRAGKLSHILPTVKLPVDEKKANIFIMIMAVIIPILSNTLLITSDSEIDTRFSAIVRVLQTQMLVAIALLCGKVYSKEGSRWHKYLLLIVVGAATIQGVSSGFLEQALIPLTVLLIMRWYFTERFPAIIIVTSLLLILFLSPVKNDYRQTVWFGGSSGAQVTDSMFGKTVFWFTSAGEYWAEVMNGQKTLSESTESSSSRLDLIHQFAHVYSMTPSVVPYQNGATYSYFAVALIPRFLWPDKPTAGGANYFYGVNYGITTEEGAKRSTFGISLLAESYINFGWVGVLFIMALQGATLYLIQTVFGGTGSGLGGQAIFVAFFVYFLNGIGSSAEIMFGNIIQSLLMGVVLLWWARDNSEKSFSKSDFISQTVLDH